MPLLDPIGGLLAAGQSWPSFFHNKGRALTRNPIAIAIIMKQGASVGWSALKELVDQVTDPSLQSNIHDYILTQCHSSPSQLSTDSHSSSSSAIHSCSEEEYRQSLHASHDHDHQRHAFTSTLPDDRDKLSPSSSSFPSNADTKSNGDAAPNAPPLPIQDLRSIRTFKAGGFVLVDLALQVPETMTVEEMTKVEGELSRRIREKFAQVGEVVCRFRPAPRSVE
jgi:divalent metal cation (Fe/Co/Zn/Cd) transporter